MIMGYTLKSEYSIWETVLANGGHTWSVKGVEIPKDGYMVSEIGHEWRIKVANFTPNTLANYTRTYPEPTYSQNRYWGAWISDGYVYLDVSHHTMSRSHALTLGKINAQLAVYDIREGVAITL